MSNVKIVNINTILELSEGTHSFTNDVTGTDFFKAWQKKLQISVKVYGTATDIRTIHSPVIGTQYGLQVFLTSFGSNLFVLRTQHGQASYSIKKIY